MEYQSVFENILLGRNEIIQQLIKMFPNSIRARNSDGRTPLHEAARMGNYTIVKILVDAGAPISQPDLNGDTPLDACLNGFQEYLKLLCIYGGSLQATVEQQFDNPGNMYHEAAQYITGRGGTLSSKKTPIIYTEPDSIDMSSLRARYQAKIRCFSYAKKIAFLFAMGLHQRLGAHSPIACTSQDILQHIVTFIMQQEREVIQQEQLEQRVLENEMLHKNQHGSIEGKQKSSLEQCIVS
jgi:ankyrin repeat protein